MNLTVRDVAKLLDSSEKTIYRWVREGAIPCYKIHDHYRFNRAEILEWATAKRMRVSPELLTEPDQDSSGAPVQGISLVSALETGGVFYRVGGRDKASVLKSVVQQMRLPPEVDLDFLLEVLLAREALESTAIGDGIAIPHVRNPIVLHVPKPTATLCFLDAPIDFGALDGKPVFCLFALVSPTARAHLHLLARIAFVLRDPACRRALETQASRDELLEAFRRVEALVVQPRARATDSASETPL